jgi:Ca2+-binding RTX toxin-like protein
LGAPGLTSLLLPITFAGICLASLSRGRVVELGRASRWTIAVIASAVAVFTTLAIINSSGPASEPIATPTATPGAEGATTPGPKPPTPTSEVTDGTLMITGDDQRDYVSLTCGRDETVIVNDNDPDTGTADCGDITAIAISGGAGNDYVTLDVRRSEFPSVTELSIDGGAGNDKLVGSHFPDAMSGGPGDDKFFDLEVSDTAWGEAGDDVFHDFEGADVLRGGTGRDTFRDVTHRGNMFHGGPGRDTVRDTTVISVILSEVRIEVSNASFDPGIARIRWVASLRSIEAARLASRIPEPWGVLLDASSFSGTTELWGSDSEDRLIGGSGNDLLRGRYGRDLLVGGPGRDTLRGDERTDVCDGGPGRDRLFSCEQQLIT